MSKKQFENAKEKLKSKLSEEELEKFCRLQIELTKLKIEIEQQEKELEFQVETEKII